MDQIKIDDIWGKGHTEEYIKIVAKVADVFGLVLVADGNEDLVFQGHCAEYFLVFASNYPRSKIAILS